MAEETEQQEKEVIGAPTSSYVGTDVSDTELKRANLVKEAGFGIEAMEIRRGQYAITGYPEPKKRFHLAFQRPDVNLEQTYYWILGHATYDWNLPYSVKINDSTATSVASSSFGDLQQKLSIQQQSVSTNMANIGRMIKDMFGLIRELRMVRERLSLYEDSVHKDTKTADAAEKTLKGVWTDLVEGGTQSPSSVLGLAQQPGFTVIPDLFFGAPPMTEEKVGEYCSNLEFNETIRNMLSRKLFQYYTWKKETRKEIEHRKHFELRYLRQHFDSIRMYLAWVKPYLKHVEKLHLNQDAMENSPWLVNSFQTQLMEIETLSYANAIKGVHPVVLFQFMYRSEPALDFHAKDNYQQKGPIHTGRVEVTVRSYAWTKDQMNKYISMRRNEDFMLLENINDSLRDAVRSLGDDMRSMLESDGFQLPDDWKEPVSKDDKKDEKKEKKKELISDPFKEAGQGIIDIFEPLVPWKVSEFSFKNLFGSKKDDKDKNDPGDAIKVANVAAENIFKNYKKSSGGFHA